MTELNVKTEATKGAGRPIVYDRTPNSDFATPAHRRPNAIDSMTPPHLRAGQATDHGDTRFRDRLGQDQWALLPPAVQHRFSRHVTGDGMRIFKGAVSSTRLSLAGRIFARLARIVGGPLPDRDGATGPATVTVTESPALGGQIWTRTYTRPGAFPQTINSVKRFSGPTGLEESLGSGLVMRLELTVEGLDLVFRSAGYDLEVFGLRITLPAILAPGTCTITHRDEGRGRFAFILALDHPWLGQLAHQVAHFEEVTQ